MATSTEGSLRVLCLNAFLRPPGVKCGSLFGDGDHKDLRLRLLIEKVKLYDLVLLQEVFEVGSRQDVLVKAAYEQGLKYHAGSISPKLFSKHIVDGGLLILSRFPIIARDSIVFKRGSGADGVCAKGVLYARVQMSPVESGALHVFTTHTQAGEGLNEFVIRESQMVELANFIQEKIESNPVMPVLLGGDFNMDARHNYEHSNGTVQHIPCHESKMYMWFEELLTNRCKDYQVFNMINCFSHENHPITNGEGHGRLSANFIHSPTKKSIGQCIDYLFLCKPIETKNPALILTPVARGSQVDKCLVQNLLPTANLPITRLSDHYGIESNLMYKTKTSNEWCLELENYSNFLMHCFPPLSFRQQKSWGGNKKIPLILAALVAGVLGTLSVY